MSLFDECKREELCFKIGIDDLLCWIKNPGEIEYSENLPLSSDEDCYIELCEKSFIKISKKSYSLDRFCELHISIYHCYTSNDNLDNWFYSRWLGFCVEMEKIGTTSEMRQSSFFNKLNKEPYSIKERMWKSQLIFGENINASSKAYRLYLGRFSFEH